MTELANYMSPFDAIRHEDEGGEYWLARELQQPLGYAQWRQFEDTVERAMAAAENSGTARQTHFADAGKSSHMPNGGVRYVQDYRLTRYGAYLVAMNGDPRKPEIAAAQTYFAVKTREAETRPAADVSQLDRRSLALMVIEAEDARLAAEAKAAELEGPAQAWNHLASADGDYAVADAAKILSRDPSIKLGRDRLFGILHELDWVYRQRADNRYRAYQTAIEAGRLSELPSSHYHPRTGQLVLDPPQVRVTVKGMQELHRRLGGTQPLQLPMPIGGAA